MEKFLVDRIDRTVDNYRLAKEYLKNDGDILNHFASLVFSHYEKEIPIDRIKEIRKEIKADSLPLDNAVKIADENILKPEKRKLNTNIINPFIAILYTASFVPVNKRTKLFPFIKDNAKINNEPTKMKEIQILYIFFNL